MANGDEIYGWLRYVVMMRTECGGVIVAAFQSEADAHYTIRTLYNNDASFYVCSIGPDVRYNIDVPGVRVTTQVTSSYNKLVSRGIAPPSNVVDEL